MEAGIQTKVDPDHWKIDVLSALNDPETEVFFNLRDVEIGKGLLRAASGRGGATDWELLIIQQNPAWWTRIRWFDGDQPVSNPFDFENGESIHELRV